MSNATLKSLQRKLINILTSVQTRDIGLEAAKEQITNLFEKYEEAEQIKSLEGDLLCTRSFIRSQHMSKAFSVWLNNWYTKGPHDCISESDWEDKLHNDQTKTGQE